MESLIDMYLAGVSVHRVEDVTELLLGRKHVVDGIYLKRSWGGEMTSVSVLVAIGVDGYREILGAAEGASESREC